MKLLKAGSIVYGPTITRLTSDTKSGSSIVRGIGSNISSID